MTDEEMKSLARELVQGQAFDFDFQFLSTDEEDMVGDMTKRELEDLYDLITSAVVTLSWPGEDRRRLEEGIRADMIDQSGVVMPFEFTGVTCHRDGVAWHEFVVEDNPEELTLYAALDGNGVRVDREVPE